jgi:hypothetical protein
MRIYHLPEHQGRENANGTRAPEGTVVSAGVDGGLKERWPQTRVCPPLRGCERRPPRSALAELTKCMGGVRLMVGPTRLRSSGPTISRWRLIVDRRSDGAALPPFDAECESYTSLAGRGAGLHGS